MIPCLLWVPRAPYLTGTSATRQVPHPTTAPASASALSKQRSTWARIPAASQPGIPPPEAGASPAIGQHAQGTAIPAHCRLSRARAKLPDPRHAPPGRSSLRGRRAEGHCLHDTPSTRVAPLPPGSTSARRAASNGQSRHAAAPARPPPGPPRASGRRREPGNAQKRGGKRGRGPEPLKSLLRSSARLFPVQPPAG